MELGVAFGGQEFFEGEDAILLHNGDVFNDWNFGRLSRCIKIWGRGHHDYG